ncbi:MAG: hypothetical protein K6F09_05290 [Clostridiales bacterium]|nr:hypothetical protein [Clostridiales bacterium]
MKFGFINLLGEIIVILLLIPNIIYALKKKKTENNAEQSVPKLLSVLEQIGRYACMALMILPVLVWEFGFKSKGGFLAYLILNVCLIIAYYIVWALYMKKPSLKSGMTLAVIPTCIFLFSGLLLHHWLLVGLAVFFGVSHCKLTYITHQAL